MSLLPILSEKELVALENYSYTKIEQILLHFPKRYENRKRFDLFPSQESMHCVCLRGKVIDTSMKYHSAGRGVYEAVIMDNSGGLFGSGRITCRWFNMQFIQRIIAAGQDISIYGNVKKINDRLIIDHPEFEVLRDDKNISIHLERIVPIYKNISGISQRRLREIINYLIHQTDFSTHVESYELDPLLTRAQGLRDIHFPESIKTLESAKRRLALEEFFKLQINIVWRKLRYSEKKGRVLGKKTTLLKLFYASLPFDFTDAQKRSIKEIAADMRTPRPMNRLLQGDVGSGKTFVAMAAILLAIDSGCQTALMAPTQILAEQHYLTFCRWLEPLGVRVGLRMGNREDSNYLGNQSDFQIIIGTHALLYDPTLFKDLGFIVVDEQHKFGVAQRASLIRQGIVPDVLVMTATPIPRTLSMTVYGDLDLSILDERPFGRGVTVTVVRTSVKQTAITKFIKDHITQGRQVYLVYPLVEESDNLKIESATEAFEKWKKRLKNHSVGLIHGKLHPDEKSAVMRRFRDGEIQVLISTTVIEVGVDVPNANVMIIYQAERFGLAQLHQLRGRIGRGTHKSYCILMTDGKNLEALEKLEVLERSSDGFEIAEADLCLRGPGDVLGMVQSGLSEIKFSEFVLDVKLILEARAFADQVIREDPYLDGIHQNLITIIQNYASITPLPSTA